MNARSTGFGLQLPNDSLSSFLEISKRAEELDFDLVAAGEHVAFHGPVANAFIRLSQVAAVTSRIKVLTCIAQAPLYPPLLLAKLASELDCVSAGRLLLGVGIGGDYPPEFEALSVPISERGSRTDEALDLLHHVWTSPGIPFVGPTVSLDKGVRVLPPPVQPGGPPIWVAGRSDAAMRRVARSGVGWLPYFYSPEQLRDSIDRIRQEKAGLEAGSSAFDTWPTVFFLCDGDGARARDQLNSRLSDIYRQPFESISPKYAVAGTVDDCLERLSEYVRAGADGIIFYPLSTGAELAEQMELIGTRIRPSLR